MKTLIQAITQFVDNVDYKESVPKVETKQLKYCTYWLNDEEWIFVTIIHEVLQVCCLNLSLCNVSLTCSHHDLLQ